MMDYSMLNSLLAASLLLSLVARLPAAVPLVRHSAVPGCAGRVRPVALRGYAGWLDDNRPDQAAAFHLPSASGAGKGLCLP
jgi:hypothetical protein